MHISQRKDGRWQAVLELNKDILTGKRNTGKYYLFQ
jgi:hypothetical protein